MPCTCDVTTTRTLDHDPRIAAILQKAELSPPTHLPILTALQQQDFGASLSNHAEEARHLLFQQRSSEPGYRPPSQQIRHFFRSKKRKAAKCASANWDATNWIFTNHEVAKIFDELLSHQSLPAPGIAHALLTHARVSSLNQLWSHLPNPKSKKLDTKERDITWLDRVCSQDNHEYIRLMCLGGLDQETLDRGFEIALANHSMVAMEVLLSHGAVASAACQSTIQEHVKRNDVALMRLLLSAPKAMSTEAWRDCMKLELQSPEARPPDLLLMCVARHRAVACKHMLRNALVIEHLQATAIMLAYGGFQGEDLHDVHDLVCEFVSLIRDEGRRLKFFMLLAEADFVTDCLALRKLLLWPVTSRQIPLIKLLVDCSVAVPTDTLYWAISRMEFSILELFKGAKFVPSILSALDFIPDLTSESDIIRLVRLLGRQRLHGQQLDRCLVRTVRKRHRELAIELINYGASIEFEQASAVEIALGNADLDILFTILRNKCSPEILSKRIPNAMALEARHLRLCAMIALTEKGVLPRYLGRSLQTLLLEDGEMDSKLIQLLLQHKAPIDNTGDGNDNVVSVAARRGNLPILTMLCDTGPCHETLSQAIPAAFSSIGTSGYDVQRDIIKLLLERGAAGSPLDETLLRAVQQDQLQLVQLLVDHGANANRAESNPFLFAIATSNLKLLRILCKSCPPSRVTLELVFYKALDPRSYNSEVLELLLSSIQPIDAIVVMNALWSSEKLRGNPNMVAIVPCLFRHGLDVNLNSGELLSFAIREDSILLLGKMLSENPSIASLTAAFHTANSLWPRLNMLDTMGLLLKKAKSAGIGQSEALDAQIISAFRGEPAGLRLFQEHNAIMSASTVAKMCAIISTEPLEMPSDQKRVMFESLVPLFPSPELLPNILSATLSQLVMNSSKFPSLHTVASLLIAKGAGVKMGTLRAALETSSLKLLDVLICNITDVDKVVDVFKYSRKLEMDFDRRSKICQYLLVRLPKRVRRHVVSDALLESLKLDGLGELSLLKVFLEHGASPVHRNGEPLRLALCANSPNSLTAVNILIQSISDDDMADIAFDVILQTPLLQTKIREGLYCDLLVWNISKQSVSQALSDSFKDGFPRLSFLELLLTGGADPSVNDGHCFAVAAKQGALVEFRALSKSKYAKREVVLTKLMHIFQEEGDVVKWFRLYLDGYPRFKSLRPGAKGNEELEGDLLFECMQRFPTQRTLLELLLAQGVSASARKNHCLCPGWKPEPCTPLIWALFAEPKISTEVISVLLSRGQAADPMYVTPLTKVSAAFACLLHKDRTSVLEALLNLDKKAIADYVLPGSSFGPLAVYPQVFQKDSHQLDVPQLDLRLASLQLGNFEAFKLLADDITPNDGTLHTAALLALPKFVNWLLKTHDPNHELEEFDNMVPLALACAAKPHPWCKLANEGMSWKHRQQHTMVFLARGTSPKWRYRHMTILHYAIMEHGYEAAKALIEALDIRNDPKQHEKYRYKDREQIEYTPEEFIMKLWDADEKEKSDLISRLRPKPIMHIMVKARAIKRPRHPRRDRT